MTRTIDLSARLAVLVAILLMFTAVGAVGLHDTSTAMKRLQASPRTMQAGDQAVDTHLLAPSVA
jgi:hypothetical protein